MTTTKNGFTIDDALAFIRKATPDERKRLAEVLHTFRKEDVQAAKRELSHGDVVVFHPKKRGYPPTIEGRVVGINKRTVTVEPTSYRGPRWRVQADLVTVVTPTAG